MIGAVIPLPMGRSSLLQRMRMADTDKISLTALVCGIVSIFMFPLLFGGLGIALGIVGMSRNEKGSTSYDLARAGLICGIVGLALWVLTVAIMNSLGITPNSLLGELGASGTGAPEQPAF